MVEFQLILLDKEPIIPWKSSGSVTFSLSIWIGNGKSLNQRFEPKTWRRGHRWTSKCWTEMKSQHVNIGCAVFIPYRKTLQPTDWPSAQQSAALANTHTHTSTPHLQYKNSGLVFQYFLNSAVKLKTCEEKKKQYLDRNNRQSAPIQTLLVISSWCSLRAYLWMYTS